MLSALNTVFDLAMVVVGFSLIILIHEAGHFWAARWAGIRVLAFSLGFGPAIVSYRKGWGLRRGSSEGEYTTAQPGTLVGVSATEYRWNVLPLGGYVKMLGQDDADPSARSGESDSYQSASVWKRMVVISAGVVFNVIAAAVLFVIVFTVGLKTEAPVVGDVGPGSPAAGVVASNAESLGVTTPGLKAGDRVVLVSGSAPDSFKDITLEAAMAARGSKVRLTVERAGVSGPLEFEVQPRADAFSKLLDLGLRPAVSSVVYGASLDAAARGALAARLTEVGMKGVEPGMRLVGAESGGRKAEAGADGLSPYVLSGLVRGGNGEPVTLRFAGSSGGEVSATVPVREEFATQLLEGSSADQVIPMQHLVGLTPVMRVEQIDAERSAATGLKTGDLFARLGEVEWPNVAEGIAEIRRGDRATIDVAVARKKGDGEWETVEIGAVAVKQGRIGFVPGTSEGVSAVVSRWPNMAMTSREILGGGEGVVMRPSGAGLGLVPGARVESINGDKVADFSGMRAALRRLAEKAGGSGFEARVVARVLVAGEPMALTRVWAVSEAESKGLLALSWLSPLGPGDFEPLEIVLKGDGPVGAVMLGLRETHRVMLSTYLTFARLVQGTVKIEHLKGPVGIAHVGTMIADRGVVWLMFFLAVISINLAVINFLPLPIVDGGHMVFLLYEALTGKPVSVAVQNVATVVGLVLVASMFLLVTYNDLANLLWR